MCETVEEVRQKMLTAWDGIYSLHARARKKVYRVNASGRSIPCDNVLRLAGMVK